MYNHQTVKLQRTGAGLKRLFYKYRFPFFGILFGVLLLPLLTRDWGFPVKESKATWLWNTSMITTQADEVVDFSKRHGVEVIFLQVDKKVPSDAYRSFIAKAEDQKIKVHALGGSPEWALKENRKAGEEFLHWVADYNRQADPKERFEGIQFDVEPYLLDRWKSRQDSITREWMENVQEWNRQAKPEGLVLGAAVPFWLDQVQAKEGKDRIAFSDWLIDQMDYVAIMAYRDKANKIYGASEILLTKADQQNKQVWVGIEMARSQEGPGVSFYGKPAPILKQELDKLTRLGDKHKSFAGIAVHNYEAWQSMANLSTN
ncbi:hypothetical protein DCC85_13525 [Paenibacillus sp. CAA11]|uniref:hypothetical protein n=1 Tax=Paenibacillus sp. CAA11 TaxID=1532905 RepID=UPI000D36CC55|nr:hypothetical protein [Paenibacillus sp. CAA11]AWB45145.1 hypothetical protein DCC85_13525 [Paenibacillus sp. CAA11]